MAVSAAEAEHSRLDGAFLLAEHEGQDRAALPSSLRQLPFTTAALLAVRFEFVSRAWVALLLRARSKYMYARPCRSSQACHSCQYIRWNVCQLQVALLCKHMHPRGMHIRLCTSCCSDWYRRRSSADGPARCQRSCGQAMQPRGRWAAEGGTQPRRAEATAPRYHVFGLQTSE